MITNRGRKNNKNFEDLNKYLSSDQQGTHAPDMPVYNPLRKCFSFANEINQPKCDIQPRFLYNHKKMRLVVSLTKILC